MKMGFRAGQGKFSVTNSEVVDQSVAKGFVKVGRMILGSKPKMLFQELDVIGFPCLAALPEASEVFNRAGNNDESEGDAKRILKALDRAANPTVEHIFDAREHFVVVKNRGCGSHT